MTDRLVSLQSSFSDFYKDVHGVRRRWVYGQSRFRDEAELEAHLTAMVGAEEKPQTGLAEAFAGSETPAVAVSAPLASQP